jgi:glucokinase
MKHILAADIGGTNSRFGHFRAGDDGTLSLAKTHWLKTQQASSAGDLIERLKAEGFSLAPEEADIAVFAVAGPVLREGFSSPPFIAWDIDMEDLRERFGMRRGMLINDFVAQAFACRSPAAEAAEEVLPGTAEPDGTVAVIGAGTALGKAALAHDGKGGFVALPSEGGHADFPFEGSRECEFQQFLLRELKDSYITWNKVVSGRGLSLVHRFLTGEETTPEELTGRLAPGSETLRWAARFYGRACRDYALETLATGGLYIAGGVAARMPALIRHEAFGREFRSSATMAHVLQRIPVSLITDEESGLWGAALAGLQRLKGP